MPISRPLCKQLGFLLCQQLAWKKDSERRAMFLSFCLVGHPVFKPMLISNLEQGVEPFIKKREAGPVHHKQDAEEIGVTRSALGE